MGKKLTKRERHIMDSMGLDLSTTKSVSEIGRISGTHKYDVWIAREVSRDKNLVDRLGDFQFVIDWAKREKPDIFTLPFSEAYELSEEWHKNLKSKGKDKIFEDEKDEERIVYKCNDGEHFFMLLKPEELQAEGNIMKHCVGGIGYASKIKGGRSLIISLRDKRNQPHVTIEIDTKTSAVVQVRAKANSAPSDKYMKLITEFAIFASGYEGEVDEDLMGLINLNF